ATYLACERAFVARLDRAVLRALGVGVLVLARDLVALGDVLGRQAHGDVRVRLPRLLALELLGERLRVAALLRLVVPGDELHARGDVDVALAGDDVVGRHADRLERG